ncbi:NLRC3-like protein [Labeo rohita]|uniref:NLRC3-like protein n=1 Tax=Labeo rohita TaxID=84645 RepID=A0A498MXD3_LABRO|nr:NLRC3-like protein [Labeo rohita]
MSNFGDDSENEMDRYAMDRPPSSYGSMQSDDHEDIEDDDFEEPVLKQETRVRLHRPDSPETAITERTNTNQSSIYTGGLVLRQPVMHIGESSVYSYGINREPSFVEPSELQSDIRTEAGIDEESNYRDVQEQQNDSAAVEVQEEQTEATTEEDDSDEIVVRYEVPKDPPPTPEEGLGLQFQHKHGSFTLRHVLTQMVRCLSQLHPGEIAYFKRCLSTHCRFRKNYSRIADLNDPLDLVDKLIEVSGMGEALHLTIRCLHNVGKDNLSVYLKKTCRRVVLQHDLKMAHDRRYYSLYEGRCRPGQQRYISDVYVEPVTVIRGNREPINLENEFIVVQMNRSFEKYRGCSVEAQKWKDEDKMFIEMMGKMSYRLILEGRDWFTVDDLSSVNLTYEDLRSRDELTTEVKRKSEDFRTWVFKFVHYTVQEYMAAMYVYVAFRKHGKNVIEPSKMSWFQGANKDRPVIDLYRPAIDRAVASPNGQLDMFLRFLVGLVTPGTEDNLRGYLLNHYHPKAKGTEEVLKHINKKLKENIHPDRKRNLEWCLVELEEGKKDEGR